MDDQKLCFYHIVRPGFLHYQPLIPQAFIRQVGTLATDQKASLKCSSGRRWPIELLKKRGSVFLGDGWKEYAIAHSLRKNDFLLFNYDDNMCFDVRIFDSSGLERVEDGCRRQQMRLNRRDCQSSAYGQDNIGKSEELRERDVYEVTEREEMFMSFARTSNQKVKSFEDSIYGAPQREETFLPFERMRNQKANADIEEDFVPYENIHHKKVKSGKVRESTEEGIYEASTLREEIVGTYKKMGTQKMKSGTDNPCHKQGKPQKCPEEKDIFVVKVESEDDLQPFEKTRYPKAKQNKKDVMKETGSSSASARKDRTGKGISRESESFRSKFPFFVKHLKEYNVDKHFILTVPNGFAKKHLPSEKSKLLLWDPEGTKSWEVILNPSASQTSLGGGWKTFAFDNNLRPGQCCVFELVEDLQLRVHTFSS